MDKKVILLCKNASETDKKKMTEAFESTIDAYLKAKGLDKEERMDFRKKNWKIILQSLRT